MRSTTEQYHKGFQRVPCSYTSAGHTAKVAGKSSPVDLTMMCTTDMCTFLTIANAAVSAKQMYGTSAYSSPHATE